MASSLRMKPFKEALSMHESQPGTFRTTVQSDYCYGDWAWGGLIASTVQTAAARFMATQDATFHSRCPDVINVQLQYLRPMYSKEIEISIRVARASKSIFTVHVSIAQDGKDCLVGYVNLSNLHDDKGVTLDTEWELKPAPAPSNLVELENNTSRDWIRYSIAYTPHGWYRLLSMVNFLLPKQSIRPSMSETWITPTDPRNTFTNETLGMVADIWPPFVENYDPNSFVSRERLLEIAREQQVNPERRSALSDNVRTQGWTSPYIITTVSLNLEVKKRLPAAGIKWLYLRAYAKKIERGKFDVEVLIMDQNMDLVALSHQVALVAAFDPKVRFSAKPSTKSKM